MLAVKLAKLFAIYPIEFTLSAMLQAFAVFILTICKKVLHKRVYLMHK
ncbi:hypothetical protein VAE151_500172 [Vibrio aestuarianus]|uniref:Uncharacterized protein n=1 Tax=Vibrio aestuarianus TaxID=28171 RepID=A0ABN8TQ78_9VIBR|nr:hypothetical protein VIBAE_A10172 [Vibrio aestuarianus subsp. francensis]CAH8183350.1 hypothetical protein VAE032_220174 [Vibrio aestuarianus]CAH8183399.1 hypothetical protein VAE055_320173 [Vibrio aestuarianus]CAH8183503.1 hypothetical protein VAE128_420173 [Vibrio aestuarianus]CAH8183580.1 hypothetical protein VAE130_530173 [Vibrio aestuarianus]